MSKSIEHDIFPELSPRAEISEKVSLIEKAWLDHATLHPPDNLTKILPNISFCQLRGNRVTYQKQNERYKGHGFLPNLLTAIYNQGFPVFFFLQCKEEQISIHLGTMRTGKAALSALLSASVGGSLYEKSSSTLSVPSYCTAITGIPKIRDKKESTHGHIEQQIVGIDALISSLIHVDWAYVVQAFPVPREQVRKWIESCAFEIKDIKEAFLLRDMQKANRMATYYVSLLEKTLKRLQAGLYQGIWQTGVYFLSDNQQTIEQGAAILSAIFSPDRPVQEPVRCHFCSSAGSVNPFINCYQSAELNTLISLPDREYSGFRLQESSEFDVDMESMTAKSLSIGRIVDDYQVSRHECSVKLDDLAKHALVAGVTAGGKTNSIFYLLEQVQSIHHLPFLVIEPAKSEYRNLFNHVDSLLVFTLGMEIPGRSAPFRINPFFFPEGIALQTHIDFIKAVFDASFVMYAPMPYILEECLYRIYTDKGWNLVTSENFRGRSDQAFPILLDLYNKIDSVVDNIGYDDRLTMDIKSALKTRIKNLCIGGKGRMLNTHTAIPMETIMERPTILELKYLGNDEEKAFMMGLVLMSLGEYYESRQSSEKLPADGLRHLTVIEEAHRLLKNVPTEKISEDISNTKGKGVETFTNLLAEIRAYGEGIVVSEQIPTKLAPEVIKNANMKILYRMVSKEDRDVMGGAMNLRNSQKRHVTCLETGEAIFFREGLDRSVKIHAYLSKTKKDRYSMGDETLSQKIKENFYDHNPSLLNRFGLCGACQYKGFAQCADFQQQMEEHKTKGDLESEIVKMFLPFVLDINVGNLSDFFAFKLDMGGIPAHCFLAHCVDIYLSGKGEFFRMQFVDVKSVKDRMMELLAENELTAFTAAIKGWACKNKEYQFAVCSDSCCNPCLFGYEVQILARDPATHNQLMDILNSNDIGASFYQRLIILIFNFFRDQLEGIVDEPNRLYPLALCYLINKLNECHFARHTQKTVLVEFKSAYNNLFGSKVSEER